MPPSLWWGMASLKRLMGLEGLQVTVRWYSIHALLLKWQLSTYRTLDQ